METFIESEGEREIRSGERERENREEETEGEGGEREGEEIQMITQLSDVSLNWNFSAILQFIARLAITE